MERRTLLTLGAAGITTVGVASPIAALAARQTEDSTSEALDTNLGSYDRAPTDPTLTPAGRDRLDDGILVLESARAARSALALDENRTTAFLTETDFDRAVLLVLRGRAPSPCYRLTVRSIDVTGTTLTGTATVDRRTDTDRICATVIAHPTALIRIQTGGRSIPETAVTIRGGAG